MSFYQRILSVIAVFGLSLFIISCGSDEKPAAPAPAPVPNAGAPTNPPPPGGPAPAPAPAPAPVPAPGLGSFIEDASGGTPIGNDANSWNALYQRFRDNVTFYGNATGSSVSALNYTVENAFTPSVKFVRSNPQTLSNQSPTIQIQAYGDSIYIQTPYFGSQSYSFQSQISLYGLLLKSTDVVGLYLSNDGASLLKVQYNTKFPIIHEYQIENYGGYWGNLQIRVTQKIINTNGTYIPQVPH